MCIWLTLNQIGVNITYMNTRRYSMATRGRQAEATRERILAAARDLFDAKSSGFTLESVAGAAGVSVQTVLRAFGSKEALIIAAVGTFRGGRSRPVEQAASPEQAVRRLFDDYEEIGDRVVWILAEEHQVAGFAEVTSLGRANHRQWVEQSFEVQLRQHPADELEGVVTALVVAMDVYVWKVLRRDLGLDRPAAEAAMVRLVRGALGTHGGETK
jgi:AcrR family transcriptional regulator